MVGFYQIYKYVQSKKEVIFGTHLINLGAFLTKIVKFDPLVMLIEILEGQAYGSYMDGYGLFGVKNRVQPKHLYLQCMITKRVSRWFH